MKKRLKINGIIMVVAFFLLAAFPALFFRHGKATFWDQMFEVIGVVCILLGQLFRVSARGFKADNSRNGNVLIEDGPYSLVRNPMYLGIFLIGLGIVFMLFKLWVAMVFVIIFIIRYIFLMFQEEKKLKSLFPDTYLIYCKKVPQRILPSLSVLFTKDISEYLPLKMAWVKKEIGSILTVLLLTILIESWEDISSRGLVVYLREAIGICVVLILFLCFVGYLNWRTINPDKK